MEKNLNPVVMRIATMKQGASRRWLICCAALIVTFCVSFVLFLLSDLVFNKAVSGAGGVVADENYPRLESDLPEKVDIALSNTNAVTPSGLALFFDNKLTTSGASPNVPATNPLLSQPSASNISPPIKAVSAAPLRNSSIPYPVSPSEYPSQPGKATTGMPDSPPMPSGEDASDRLEKRTFALRRGEAVAAVSEVYDIEDVTPVGVVGNSRSREVLFYSPATKQTFSAPLGAKFRNGTLEGASQNGNVIDGVRFKNDINGVVVTSLWSKGKNKTPSAASGDAPVLSNQPDLTPEVRQTKPPKPQVVRRSN